MSSFFQNVTAWKANILSDTPSSLEKLQALQEILNARMELWTSMEGYVPVLETVANTPVKKVRWPNICTYKCTYVKYLSYTPAPYMWHMHKHIYIHTYLCMYVCMCVHPHKGAIRVRKYLSVVV